MSKSTLSITVSGPLPHRIPRTIEVPCRLPEAFTFWFHLPHYGSAKATAYLSEWELDEVEVTVGLPVIEAEPIAASAADAILASVKSDLATPNSAILVPIALAYEAEVAAYDAAVKAHAALPRVLHSLALAPTHPSESNLSPAVLMLGKYVEHVVEQACKAQSERAEQAKVTP